MSSLKIEDEDIMVGLSMMAGALYVREEWQASLETEALGFFERMAVWSMANAKMRGPVGSPEFLEEGATFVQLAMLLIGPLWSANGRHAPSVSETILDESLDALLVEGKMEGEIEEVSKKVWEIFVKASDESGIHGFGRSMIIVLATAFLRAANLESEEETREALNEAEEILRSNKAD